MEFVFSLMLSLFFGFAVGFVLEREKNYKSVVRSCNRRLSKEIMSGRDYLKSLREMSLLSTHINFVNELERIFEARNWLYRRAKFNIIEKNEYTVSADFDSFEDFAVKVKSTEKESDE